MAKRKNTQARSAQKKEVPEARHIKLLRKKISYRKSRIKSLNASKPKKYKIARSKYYSEVVNLNKQLKKLLGIRVKSKKKKRVVDQKTGQISYTDKVWQFENKLRDFIHAKTFKKIYIKNVGKTFYVASARPSTILYNYDVARNEAYVSRHSETPLVDVVEDYENDQLTLHIIY